MKIVGRLGLYYSNENITHGRELYMYILIYGKFRISIKTFFSLNHAYT